MRLVLRSAVAACVLGVMAGAPARAADDEPTITVVAPRAVHAPHGEAARSPYTGAPVVVTTLSIPLRIGDLDLAREADVARLRQRVAYVAHDACVELDRVLPLDPDPDCQRKAIAETEPAVAAALARAH